MNTTYIDATELKNNVSEILNSVYYEKKIAIVKRYGKTIAKIVPYSGDEKTKKNVSSLLDKYYGAIPDFPDVTSLRRSRKKSVTL